jgi:hypothetical protein
MYNKLTVPFKRWVVLSYMDVLKFIHPLFYETHFISALGILQIKLLWNYTERYICVDIIAITLCKCPRVQLEEMQFSIVAAPFLIFANNVSKTQLLYIFTKFAISPYFTFGILLWV